MYTIGDIEVFVLTHKRPEFLKETLNGYLHQTIQGFRLAVFSNGHSPATKELLQEYAAKGVEGFYMDEECPHNLLRALQAARQKILVIAHDDDFIHPRYIETVLALFNKLPNLAVLLSGQNEEQNGWERPASCHAYHFLNEHEFAAYIYSSGEWTYSSACYKTEAVAGIDPRQFAHYGKVSDVPFITAICTGREAAVTKFPFIKTRLHEGQDTYAFATGPTAEQWFCLSLFYKHLLDINSFPCLRWLFRLQNFRHIRFGWRDWCKCEYTRMNFYQFCGKALAKGALTIPNIVLGLIVRGRISKYVRTKLAEVPIIEP